MTLSEYSFLLAANEVGAFLLPLLGPVADKLGMRKWAVREMSLRMRGGEGERGGRERVGEEKREGWRKKKKTNNA